MAGILALVLAAWAIAWAGLSAAEPGRGVLIDAVHAVDSSPAGLRPDEYDYHRITGFRFALEYLRSRGVPCERLTAGQLTARRLATHRVLLINLVSAERPPFLVGEIVAVREFIRGGGSLLVVTDHSNAYYHAHVLRPLLTELDIESPTDTACDQPPHTLGSGHGWILVERFAPHPVTSGLKRLGIQTGGRVDGRFAVALTSDRSWADAWRSAPYGEENAPGFLGNMTRDPPERQGPLGVVLAKTFGKGRIVVVADQNMLSDAFLNYADNYRLWLNVAAWLLDDRRLADPAAYLAFRSPRIFCYEPFERAAFGNSAVDGCYNAWVLLNRYYWCFAGDRPEGDCDLAIFAFNDSSLPRETIAPILRHLRRGKHVLILNAQRETLWDEKSVGGGLLAAMSIAPPHSVPGDGKAVFAIPGGGAIEVLGPDQLLDNGLLPPPMRPPTAAEKPRIDGLLRAVHGALGSGSKR